MLVGDKKGGVDGAEPVGLIRFKLLPKNHNPRLLVRTPTPPSSTIINLLAPLSNLFVGTDFDRLTDHLTCLMTVHNPAFITQVQRTAVEERHYSRHRDFLAHNHVEPACVLTAACQATGVLERTTALSHGREVLVCVIDDTLRRRSMAPGLFGAAWHHDHAKTYDQTSTCWGQNLVLLGVIPRPLDPQRVRTHLSDFELWVPLKRSIESGCATLPYETKSALGALMLMRQREQLPSELERLVLVDSLYAKAPFLNAVRRDAHTHVLGRLASNRVVFEPPPARTPGKRGAPRKYGARVDWKAQFAQHAQTVDLCLYGRQVKAQMWAMTGRVRRHGQDVRLVVCQVEKASTPSLFLCTDTTLEDVEILRLYGARFSIEETIRDLVCELGLGQERSRDAKVYQMQIALKLVASLLLEHLGECQPQEVVNRIRDPWRKKSTRLTMGQLRHGLQWECWSGQSVFSCEGSEEVPGQNSRAGQFEAVA